MNDELSFLLEASPEEWDTFIGCPHTGKSYTEVGRLTGEVFTRCCDCHTALPNLPS
ncbi:hypothetical protein E3G59_001782 [Mycobacteroides abscessus]|uniref:Uncharacterized protein n=2 Tax=Mycobacteroides abscessus TaxID=36809 RepID=B1MNF5_MYCA9|nr:hypothetical protein [Mycobacteroides abscessus]QPO17575.1 hypothetical protein PHIGD23-1_104 [Mycobacterium phage phiGD23-1]QPO17700.1 hypothetical protein PHIGD22-1_104 [Mycobacterium phage phiGD22-1]QPO17876.1 hypothetical protein PROPHIGD20-1_102 [Mycobacterium phage phiGD20-1]QSM01736.1 hypothetical protein PROPHIGD11-1_69 [Mycobacterium phage prophiGD11-1]QSM02117.1 hypothetical protein PROPHIGD20-1_68 [Mycobacterium phage prophiGD20-1]QSM02529.1 hypothetical protein PROPHIGD17-2_65 